MCFSYTARLCFQNIALVAWLQPASQACLDAPKKSIRFEGLDLPVRAVQFDVENRSWLARLVVGPRVQQVDQEPKFKDPDLLTGSCTYVYNIMNSFLRFMPFCQLTRCRELLKSLHEPVCCDFVDPQLQAFWCRRNTEKSWLIALILRCAAEATCHPRLVTFASACWSVLADVPLVIWHFSSLLKLVNKIPSPLPPEQVSKLSQASPNP